MHPAAVRSKHDGMSEAALRRPTTTIRPYRPLDHGACRALWAELTGVDRRIFGDPSIGGADPGAAFEEYLTRLDLAGMWVADDPDEGVVGFVGLVLGAGSAPGISSGGRSRGTSGAVSPVVVTAPRRGEGIGRALLAHVAGQARQRGMRRLSIAPAPRNIDALRCLQASGYDTLAAVTLTLDLTGSGHGAGERLDLQGLSFSY